MFNLGRKSFFRTGWVNMEAIFELRLDYRDVQILYIQWAPKAYPFFPKIEHFWKLFKKK